ncbi:MAG TPA: bile acid:sodium symporter [Candidatus Dormibacteraeota bacterium]
MSAPAPAAGSTVRRRQSSLGALGPLHDRLLWYVLLAAALGLAWPAGAARLEGAVPLMLAGQVAGVTLTLTARQLLRSVRRPRPVLVALAVQWLVIAPAGIAFGRLLGGGTVGTGVVICAVVPAEITSSLVAVLAGGSGEVGILVMAGSLALGTVLTPLLVTLGVGGSAHVDAAALTLELALCVALPLVVGVALRTRINGLAAQGARCLDLAAISVVLVVFVAAGTARDLIGSLALLGAAGACLVLQAMSYGIGLGVGRLLRLPRAVGRAVLFPMGMREFGIATAVALSVAPGSTAVAGVYGILVMVTGPALAMRLRHSARRAAEPSRRPPKQGG